MKKFYTTVGIFKLKNQEINKMYPTVILSGKECKLDVQEMTVWAALNWRILNYEQLFAYYEEQEKKFSLICSRSFEETLNRLVVRGLIAAGVGETEEEALYNLISRLYIIPLYQSAPIRIISFLRLVLVHRVSFDKAKIIFNFDRKTKNEKEIMQLAFSAPMSTAEIIKCVDKNIDCILNEDDVVEFLYDDRNITSENIAEESRTLPSARSVIAAVSNLYLRKQILFERM